jgi:hypothetical protein
MHYAYRLRPAENRRMLSGISPLIRTEVEPLDLKAAESGPVRQPSYRRPQEELTSKPSCSFSCRSAS